jgi:hypothetical protein
MENADFGFELFGMKCSFIAVTDLDILAAREHKQRPTVIFLIVGLDRVYDDMIRLFNIRAKILTSVKTMVFLVTVGGADDDAPLTEEEMAKLDGYIIDNLKQQIIYVLVILSFFHSFGKKILHALNRWFDVDEDVRRWEEVAFYPIKSIDSNSKEKGGLSYRRSGFVISRAQEIVGTPETQDRIQRLGRDVIGYETQHGSMKKRLPKAKFQESIGKIIGSLETSLPDCGVPMSFPTILKTFTWVNLKENDVVLEIGCGSYPRLALAAAFVTKTLTTATDFPDKLKHVKLIYETLQQKNNKPRLVFK